MSAVAIAMLAQLANVTDGHCIGLYALQINVRQKVGEKIKT